MIQPPDDLVIRVRACVYVPHAFTHHDECQPQHGTPFFIKLTEMAAEFIVSHPVANAVTEPALHETASMQCQSQSTQYVAVRHGLEEAIHFSTYSATTSIAWLLAMLARCTAESVVAATASEARAPSTLFFVARRPSLLLTSPGLPSTMR